MAMLYFASMLIHLGHSPQTVNMHTQQLPAMLAEEIKTAHHLSLELIENNLLMQHGNFLPSVRKIFTPFSN